MGEPTQSLETSLLLFGRLPRPGRVKTRLADQLGDEQAAAFYRFCAERLIQQCQLLPDGVERFFCYADAEDGAEVQQWVGPQFYTLAQVGEDLGQRLAHALVLAFRRGARKAVVVATDVPDLSVQIMVEAIRSLEEHDVVLGPCSDGGYYLLGAKRLHSELFAGMPWSTNQVLDATLRVVRNLGLSVAMLPVLADIDTAEDFWEWRSKAAGQERLAMERFEQRLSGQAGAGYDFLSMLHQHNLSLAPIGVSVMQMNITSLCNQSCSHCRVDASPKRTEQMDRHTIDRCLSIMARCPSIETLDITGGAPELNRDFDRIVVEARGLGRRVVVRHNLTVTFDGHPRTGEPKTYLPEFFAANGVEVIASLPHYEEQLVREQRGPVVFEKSIKGLQRLNAVGYGIEGSGLTLNLVHNPIGAALPGDQQILQTEFKHELRSKYSIEFNGLYTMTNVPVKRFKQWLERSGDYDRYLSLLVSSFNPAVATGVMCRSAISVAYDGRLYDCDINQALDMQIAVEQPMTVYDFDLDALMKREIRFGPHCFACTAAAGSG